jgi:DNA mismatch endonuclease, patch repair protein
MADILNTIQRSALMSRIGPVNSKPELIVRRCLHRMGYRYALHDTKLPGTPDIILRKYSTIVFVHGCFWHRHVGCKKSTMPKTRQAFWEAKFVANVRRDRRVGRKLRAEGWHVIVVWECQTHHLDNLTRFLSRRLATGTPTVRKQ